MKYPFPVPTLTLTVTLSPNHYTMNNFGRPCTQFHLMYTTPLYISQEFNHEFNHLRYTLHLPSTQIVVFRLKYSLRIYVSALIFREVYAPRPSRLPRS